MGCFVLVSTGGS